MDSSGAAWHIVRARSDVLDRDVMRMDEAGKSLFTSYLGDEVIAAPPPEPELDPPFDIVEPQELRCPLVFSSPHSGNVYPASFLNVAKLDPLTLRRSEDAFVDEL